MSFFLVTANQTKWDQHNNTTLLDDRVDDITKWKITLERCIVDTDNEILVIKSSINSLSVQVPKVWR